MENKNTISHKFSTSGQRVLRFFKLFPTRLGRLGYHVYRGFTFQVNRKEYWKDEANVSSRASVLLLWIFELLILILELFGVGELYEIIADFGKSKTRRMQPWEIKMAREVYGNSIDYQSVRVDESAWLGPKQYNFCYVSFFLVNSWGRIENHTMIHELMHVWQYQQMGAIYMIRALIAQHTEKGYDYGGIDAIQQKIVVGEGLLDFNLEQQADIVTDCFLLQQGFEPQWGSAKKRDLNLYQQFISVLHKERMA